MPANSAAACQSARLGAPRVSIITARKGRATSANCFRRMAPAMHAAATR
jgi:hypothetical protein